MDLLWLFLCLMLASCTHKKIQVREKTVESINSTKEITKQNVDHQPTPKQNSSLWKGDSLSFLSTNKSWKIGDIVKIRVKIHGKAEFEDSKTDNSRRNISNPATRIMGGMIDGALGILKASSPSSPLSNLQIGSELKNIGTIRDYGSKENTLKKDLINFEIAAMVKEVLPGGNLIIGGSQEVFVNGESRKMYVQGIIRPRDINADNCVDSDKIANAKIAYGVRESKNSKRAKF